MLFLKTEKFKNKNRILYYLILVLLIPILALTVTVSCSDLHGFNGDNLFMFAHADVLRKEGFITEDVLRMHEGFHFLIPQWAFALSLSEIVKNFGPKAASFVMMAVLSLISISLYYCCFEISKEKAASAWLTAICSVLYFFFYSDLRPYNVSVLLGLLEVLTVEKYIRSHAHRNLILISVISVLEVNFHNSLWILLTLINMCYLGEVIIKWIMYGKRDFCKEVFLTCAVTIVSGLLNPYGLEGMLYIFPSMKSIEPLVVMIAEIRPITFSEYPVYFAVTGILVLSDAILLGIYWKKTKKMPSVRFILMYFGFLFLGIYSVRNFQFIIIFSQLATVSYKSLFFKKLPYKELVHIGLAAILSEILLFAVFFDEDYYPSKEYEKAAHYLAEQDVPKDAKIFSSADCGSALIFEGYKPYFDCMAELYGIANNRKKDVASELVMFAYMDTEESRSFLNGYGFEYAVTDDPYFAEKFRSLPEWVCKYDSDGGWVFKVTQ